MTTPPPTRDRAPEQRRAEPTPVVGRGRFVERRDLSRAVTSARQRRESVAVIHLDLDRFHQVNMRWGQEVGDEVLARLGPRLAEHLGEGLVAPAEGDAFVALVTAVGPDAAWRAAERLLEAVREPLLVGSTRVRLGATAGVAHAAGVDAARDVLELAYLACRRGKSTAPGTVVGYDEALAVEAANRQRIEEGLRRAIDHDELVLHLQPEVDLRDGRVVGVEALVRWAHPTDGLLLPGAFLPVAEQAGLMIDVGDRVLREAATVARRWADHEGGPVRVWVNLAAQQLAAGQRFVDGVRSTMEAAGITPRSLGFEVTESTLLEDLPSAVGVLGSLRDAGFEIALDDFGTGYSSLTYLRQLPVSAVKIDRTFVAGIGGSLADEAIVDAVIDLAHALGLRVIAEGVEDVRQAEVLARMGADQAQGFHFGRPVPADDLEPLLGRPWCGAPGPAEVGLASDRRADELPGYGSPRARLLLAALDSTHDSIIVTSAVGDAGVRAPIVYVNAAFETETGHRARDVVGRTVELVLPDPLDPQWRTWFESVHRDVRSATIEMPNRRADGSTFLCELTLSPIVDERGVLTHWLHVRRDLTQRRAAEGDRARFEGLIEQSSSMVFLAESGGRWIYANEAQRRALGLPADAPIDEVAARLMFQEEVRAELFAAVRYALGHDGRWSGPASFTDPDTGQVTEVEMDITVVDDPLRPGVKVYAGVSRDVTEVNRLAGIDERRRDRDAFAARLAQRALEPGDVDLLADLDAVLGELAALVRADVAYVDEIDESVGVLRPVGCWSGERYVRPGPVPDEIPLGDLEHWVARLRQRGVIVDRSEGESTWWREVRDAFAVGRPASSVNVPIRVGSDLLGVLGLGNVDDGAVWGDDDLDLLQRVADTLAHTMHRRRTEVAVRESEQRYQAMLANVGDMLVVVDRAGWVRYANDRVAVTLGYDPAEVIGWHFLQVVHPDDHQLAFERFSAAASDGVLEPTELRSLHRDGSVVWVEVDTAGVEDPRVGGFMISLRNITGRRQDRVADARRAEYDGVLAGLSRWALQVETDELLGGLDEHLERLGRTLEVDVSFVSLLDADRIRTVGGWSSDQVPAAVHVLPTQLESMPATAALLRRLDPVVVDDVDQADDAGQGWLAEWRRFPHPDRASIHVPLGAGGRCLGDLGVAMQAGPRAWSIDEVRLVTRAAEIVAAVLARRRAEASLRTSEARLAALLDGSLDVVVVIDEQGFVQWVNGTAERSLGYGGDMLIGTHVAELVHPDDHEQALTRLQSLVGGAPTDLLTVRLVRADGTLGWWEVRNGITRDPVAGGFVLTCREITGQMEAAAEAAARVEHLRYAFDLAQSALDLDADAFVGQLGDVCADIARILDADFVYVDEFDETNRVLVNLGGWVADSASPTVSQGQTIGFDDVPAWVARLRTGAPVVVDDVRTVDEPWVTEKLEHMGPEASLIAVGMSAARQLFGVIGVSMNSRPRVWTDDEVAFIRIVGETMAHVLDRRRLDLALRASEERFRLLSEAAADVVLLLDVHGRIVYASPSSESLVGWTPEQLHHRSIRSIIHPDDMPSQLAGARLLANGEPFNSEIRLQCADGGIVWVASSASPVFDPDSGMAIEYRVSVRDITERKRLEAELERLALHDSLTGLANRVLLRSHLEVATSKRNSPNHVAVLLLDLDGFKEVNDTHGHAVGDEVLRLVAERLQALTRPSDTLARTGGDEFVLLCPDTDLAGAVAIAERIVDRLGRPFAVGDVRVTVGASVGVAHHEGQVDDPDWLMIEADHAMYTAKRAGRSRVRVASSATRAS